MRVCLRFAVVLGVLAALTVPLAGCCTHPASHEGAHWGYEGETGPDHWGDLSPEFVLARTGKEQSPIDIGAAEPAQGSLQCEYRPCALDLVNNGHTIQQTCEPGGILIAGEERYELKQFHFHSPSEHTIEGRRYDMELHLVHVSESGAIAVVGILLQQGAENTFLAQFWDRLPAEPGGKVSCGEVRINAADVLPDETSWYAYRGSLTTPPCTEGVQWYVLSRPVGVSEGQLREFRKLYDGNYRPVQPLNGRAIRRFE